MPQESIRIGKAELSAFVAAIFVAVGLKKDHADAWADMLVWANLRGTDSHGIIRIPRYIDLIKAKSINHAPHIRVERKDGAAVVLEADRAPSAVAMTRAMTEAMDCARKVHVGMCAARNVTHTGAIGYFADHVALGRAFWTPAGIRMPCARAKAKGVQLVYTCMDRDETLVLGKEMKKDGRMQGPPNASGFKGDGAGSSSGASGSR